jgi:hypothetical protein
MAPASPAAFAGETKGVHCDISEKAHIKPSAQIVATGLWQTLAVSARISP